MAEAAVTGGSSRSLWETLEAAGPPGPSLSGRPPSIVKVEQGHSSFTEQILPPPLRSSSPRSQLSAQLLDTLGRNFHRHLMEEEIETQRVRKRFSQSHKDCSGKEVIISTASKGNTTW